MSSVKYFATMTGAFGPIRKVVVDRETPKCIWSGGMRQNKESELGCYFDSFEEAKTYLLYAAERNLSKSILKLHEAKDRYVYIKDLAEPCE